MTRWCIPDMEPGSLCGKNISKETVSTMGEQRRTNYALQSMSEADFIALVTADQPDAPSYFTYDAVAEYERARDARTRSSSASCVRCRWTLSSR